MTVPNILTLSRIALIPFICFYIHRQKGHEVALLLFTLAGLTDFFDGYVAEKTNSRSALGALLDPLADKLLVILVYFFLASSGRIQGFLLWPCALIISREIIVLGIRGALGAHRLPTIGSARWKTALQLISGGLLLLPPSPLLSYGTHLALWAAAGLGCWSASLYGYQALALYNHR